MTCCFAPRSPLSFGFNKYYIFLIYLVSLLLSYCYPDSTCLCDSKCLTLFLIIKYSTCFPNVPYCCCHSAFHVGDMNPCIHSIVYLHASDALHRLSSYQECLWLNSLLSHIRQNVYDLQRCLLSGPDAFPWQLKKIADSLVLGQVPIAWIHPNCQPTTHSLSSWQTGE